jgi:hypothetical protein
MVYDFISLSLDIIDFHCLLEYILTSVRGV